MGLTASLILRKPRSCCLEERSAPIPLFLLLLPEIISERDIVPRGIPQLARVRRMKEQRGPHCSAAVFSVLVEPAVAKHRDTGNGLNATA